MSTRPAVVAVGLWLLIRCSVSPLSAEVTAGNFPPDRSDPTAFRCDELVTPPEDSQRVGNGVELEEIDLAQALPACQAAAGRTPSRPRYQYLYGRALFAAGRYAEAVEQFAAADRGGSAAATAALGSSYVDGLGVTPDPAKAAALFERAGDGGYPLGYALLGLLYATADPPDYAKASALFDRAARAGSPAGETYLGELYVNGMGVPKDPQKALSLFQQAAGREPEAMIDLGIAYFSGLGAERDPALAARWLSRPAQLGYAQAQDLLGYLYETGEGVEQNADYAVAWYRRSAEQGSPFGMTHLAEALSAANQGAAGIEWLRKAADMGYVEAETDLAIDYDSGWDGLPKDARQAAFWYAKAARQGNVFSQVKLGEHYERGDGVERDLAMAKQLYRQVAEQYPDHTGDPARLGLARLESASAPEAPGAATPPDDSISGGVITPPASEPAPARTAPPQPATGSRNGAASAPLHHRPLPTGPQDASAERTKDMLILGAIVIGGAWLLSGSSSGSSGSGGISIPQLPPIDPTQGSAFAGAPCWPKGSVGCW